MDAEHHRKVELQSPADLSYLTSQIRSAAQKKLDLHLPPVSNGSEPDDLRRKTEEFVDAFVAQVLEGMRHNISINGMDVVNAEGGGGNGAAPGAGEGKSVVEVEEYEELDNKLRERLRTTIAKRDTLVGKIAAHRRTTPQLASQRFKDQFGKDMEGLEVQRVESEKVAAEVREAEIVGVEALKRHEDVQRNWERAVESLMTSNRGLPETRARLERCGEVVVYLEGGKGAA